MICWPLLFITSEDGLIPVVVVFKCVLLRIIGVVRPPRESIVILGSIALCRSVGAYLCRAEPRVCIPSFILLKLLVVRL